MLAAFEINLTPSLFRGGMLRLRCPALSREPCEVLLLALRGHHSHDSMLYLDNDSVVMRHHYNLLARIPMITNDRLKF